MKFYSYATRYEDFATAFDALMMSFLFGTKLDVGITDKGTQSTWADNVVAWGQRGRYGAAIVAPRVRNAVRYIYADQPDILGSIKAHIDNLPEPTPLRPGETWLENAVLGDGANQGPPRRMDRAASQADDIFRTNRVR